MALNSISTPTNNPPPCVPELAWAQLSTCVGRSYRNELRLGKNVSGVGSPDGGAYKMGEAAFNSRGFTEVLAVGSDGSWAHIKRADGRSIPSADAFKVGASHGYDELLSSDLPYIVRSHF